MEIRHERIGRKYKMKSDGRIHTFNYSHMGFFVEWECDGEEFEGTLAITNSNSVLVGNIFENPELYKTS